MAHRSDCGPRFGPTQMNATSSDGPPFERNGLCKHSETEAPDAT